MKHARQVVVSTVQGLVLAFGLATAAMAADEADKPQRKDLALKGDAVCTRCHDETESYPVLAIGKTQHGTVADSKAPTCTSCHGESTSHVQNLKKEGQSERPKPDRSFAGQLVAVPADDRVDRYFGQAGKRTSTPVEDRNSACLSCHQKDSRRSHWDGSAHQSRDVACTSCHQIHTTHDKVRDKRTQPEVCFACHKEQRAQINRVSHHPIPEGKMGCTDCHNGHGSVGPKLMKRDSVNETCYTCHMEKRGPFVHTHEPVAEDCSNCHNPHGTTAESLLKARPPFLCHQCHTPHGANIPALAGQIGPVPLRPTTGSSGKSNINITQGRGCVNCHTQVHGTNNPSTANPTPQFNLR
jgi:DmsE family decaheme c-type cytochrome